MDATSLQPCSGASGEYAGLMAIKDYQKARGGHVAAALAEFHLDQLLFSRKVDEIQISISVANIDLL